MGEMVRPKRGYERRWISRGIIDTDSQIPTPAPSQTERLSSGGRSLHWTEGGDLRSRMSRDMREEGTRLGDMFGFSGRNTGAAQTISAQMDGFQHALSSTTARDFSTLVPPAQPSCSCSFQSSGLPFFTMLSTVCFFGSTLAGPRILELPIYTVLPMVLHSQHPRVTLPQAHCEWGGSPEGSRCTRQHRGGHDEVCCFLPLPSPSHGGRQARVMHPLWDGAERRPVQCVARTQRREAMPRRERRARQP